MKEINECVKDIKAKYFSRQPASKRKTDSEELEKPSRSKMLKKEKNDGDKDITIKLAYKVKSTTGLRRISSKSGGGVYELKLKKHESTYDCIKSEGEKYFLGGAGKCETHLELDGKQIDCFLNDNGDQCTYAEYLKTNHLFASRCKLYLVSSTSVEQSSSSVLASPKSLTILSENSASTSFGDSGTLIKNSSLKEHNQLKDDLLSVFSEDQVYITFQKDSEQSSCNVAGKIGMLELESSKNPSILDIDSVDINPLNYGYKVRKIVKYQEDGNKCFLDWKPSESGNTQEIVYPCAENKTNIILHGPDEVNGFEVKDYMLGIVVEHSQCCTIEWIRDGKIFKSGLGLTIILVSQAYTMQL